MPKPNQSLDKLSTSLHRVIIPVTDIDAASEFYQSIFGSVGERVSPGRHYFDCDNAIIALLDSMADGDGVVTPPNPEYIYFAVDDLLEAQARIVNAGGTIDEPGIVDMPWGERLLYTSDPFGNKLSFVDVRTAFSGTLRG